MISLFFTACLDSKKGSSNKKKEPGGVFDTKLEREKQTSSSSYFPSAPRRSPRLAMQCRACHSIKNPGTKWTVGPGWKGLGKRVSREYLEKWLKDPGGTFDAGGPEIDALNAGYKAKKKKNLVKGKLMMIKYVKKFKLDTKTELRKEIIDYMMSL